MQFIGDIGAFYGALYGISTIILNYFCRIDVLLDNHLLKSIFRQKVPDISLKVYNLRATFIDFCIS